MPLKDNASLKNNIPDINLVREKFGNWDAHSVEYAPGCFTFGGQPTANWLKSRADSYSFLIELMMRRPLSQCRILDIGCFEGGLSFHFAQRGAEVVGLEIRDDLLGRCQFLKECFPDLRLSFTKGDMLALSVEKFGKFDAILMAGTLYHVNAPDLLPVLKSLNAMSTGLVVIDTHVAAKTLEKFEVDGLTVYGRSFIEHNEGDSNKEKANRVRASFENNFSFWPTEASLVNLVRHAGFDYCLRAMSPQVQWPFADRGIWLAGRSATESVSPFQQLPDPEHRPTDHKMFHNMIHARKSNPDTSRL